MIYLVEILGDNLGNILEFLEVVGLIRPDKLVDSNRRKVADGHLITSNKFSNPAISKENTKIAN